MDKTNFTRKEIEMICTKCKKMISASNGKIIDEQFYCKQCLDKYKKFLSLCYQCEQPIFTETAYKTENNHYVCKMCRAEYCGFCKECGGLFHEIDLAWLEDEQREICIYCARKQRKRGNL